MERTKKVIPFEESLKQVESEVSRQQEEKKIANEERRIRELAQQQQREREIRSQEEATRVAKESKAAEAARLAQEEADRTFALRLQAEEEAKGKGQGLGQVASNGPSVGVSQGTATPSKGESGRRHEGGPSSLPVSPPSRGQQPLAGSVGTNPPTVTPGSSKQASSPFARVPSTVNPNQPKVQAAINEIHRIFQECLGTTPSLTSTEIIGVYQLIKTFIERVSELSPEQLLNEEEQEAKKDLWNMGIIQRLINLSFPPVQAVSLSSLSASSSLANSPVFTPEQVGKLCHYLGEIKSVFVKSPDAVSARSSGERSWGGQKKKAIRKTKRKSTSVKSKPSRKYKKRSVSTKK